jgi:hypothetical protein
LFMVFAMALNCLMLDLIVIFYILVLDINIRLIFKR